MRSGFGKRGYGVINSIIDSRQEMNGNEDFVKIMHRFQQVWRLLQNNKLRCVSKCE